MLSEHLSFVTEMIIEILKLEEEKEVEYSDDERIRKQRIKHSIQELHKELSRVVVYLRHVEKGRDEQMHDHDRFYLELNVIADSSDDILKCVISNDVSEDTAGDISLLVDRIRNCHHLLPSGSTYNINTGGNTCWSGFQFIGSTQIYIDPSHSKPLMTKQAPRPKTCGQVSNLDLVGFNSEIQTLLNHLTQYNKFCVVGNVGMAGSGKTTLAKHIYHHPQIKTKFDCRAWVCVSQCWDTTNILNTIWRQVTKDLEATIMDYHNAVNLLYELLSSQSYLVILDDIWSIDAWHDISRGLPKNNGSKIVVTTRIKTLPKDIYHPVRIVELKRLDDKESYELFKRRAFSPNEKLSPVLLKLGEEMVKKCRGLPLSIVALAGVLKIDRSQINWERKSKALAHNILKQNNQSTQGVVKEVIALSYYELPHQLKQCVLYLRFFPEDYEINARNLIKMWITEGLIGTNEDQESTAEGYLDEIVQRHIVQVVKTDFMGQVSRFRIHDVIRQVLVDIDKERIFLRDSLRLASTTTLYGDGQNNFSSMSQSERIANLERVFLFEPSSHIRSIIFLNGLDLSKYILQSMFVKFRFLRVLIFDERFISWIKIPEEIGNLIHLKYFEFRGSIKQTPVYIENLKNTQVLLNLTYITDTKINLSKLKELRHLYLPHLFFGPINMVELKLERLEKLKTLWNVRGGEWMLLGMTKLSAVLEKLRVLCISNEEQLYAIFRTPSIISNNLQTLELNWNGSGYRDVELRKMNILRECKSLKKLKLCGQIQASIDIIFPPNLIKLDLRHTCLENGEVMNIISESCPHLKILKFGFMAYRGEKLVCSANSFPELEKLTLDNLQNLKMWVIESSAMPSLQYLTIRQCEQLDLNPEGWTFISKVPQLTHIKDEHVPVRNLNRVQVCDFNIEPFGLQYTIARHF